MKRTQKLVTWGIVILVVLVVLLMLVSNLRRSSRVVLPDTNTSAEGGGDLPAEEIGKSTRLNSSHPLSSRMPSSA